MCESWDIKLFNFSSILAFVVAPIVWSTILPFLKYRIVGIDLISYLAVKSGLSASVFTLQIFTLPSNSYANWSIVGAGILQGPHQGAQKSTTFFNSFFHMSYRASFTTPPK